MTGDDARDARLVRLIAVDLIRNVTEAPTMQRLEYWAEWNEDHWLNRALGDVAVDDVWSDLSVETCLFMVRTIRSARRMRKLELHEMAVAAVSA